MAVTITIEADSSEAESALVDLTKEMRKADDAAKDLSESAQKVARDVEDVKEKAKGINFSSALTATAAGFNLLKQGAGSVLNAIDTLSERGQPGFRALKDSVGELKQSFIDLANTPEVQNMARRTAGFISGTLIPAIESIPSKWRAAQDYVADGVASLGEKVGLFAEGTRSETDAMQAQAEQARRMASEALKVEEERLRLQDRRTKIAEGLAAIEQAAAQQEFDRYARELHNIDAVATAIEEETRLLDEAAREAEFTDAQRIAGLQKIARLRMRSIELIDEEKRKEQEAAAAVEKAAEDAFRAKQEARNKEIVEAIKAADKRIAEEQRVAKEAEKIQKQRVDRMAQQFSGRMSGSDFAMGQVQIEQKAQADILRVREQATQAYVTGDVKGFFQARQEEYRILAEALKAQKELRDRFRKEGGITDQIKSGFGQQDVLNQVIEGRQSKAMDEFIKDKGYASSTGDRRKQLQAEWKRMEKEIARQANRDFRAGRIGQDEADKATQQLTSRTIDAAEKSGKFSQDTIAAMRQAADAAQTQSEQLQSHDEELQNISEQIRQVQEQLNETAQAGGRRRAQSK